MQIASFPLVYHGLRGLDLAWRRRPRRELKRKGGCNLMVVIIEAVLEHVAENLGEKGSKDARFLENVASQVGYRSRLKDELAW